MKILMPLFILIALTSFAQNGNTFQINSLPTEGVLLDKGWKFQMGDNPDFAKTDFDDSAWENIDPTKDIFDLPQIPKTGQICWLRLRLSVDSAINTQLVMMIEQSGASEIYLNGKLIHSLGILSKNVAEIKAYSPLREPIEFPIKTGTLQILSVKYAFQPNVSYGTHWGTENRLLKIKICNTEDAVEQLNQILKPNDDVKSNVFKIGFNSLLSILFFALYLFYKTQKVNLYFSIYALLEVCVRLIVLYVQKSHYVAEWFLPNNLIIVLAVIEYLILNFAVYRLFEEKLSLFFYFLIFLGIVSIPCGAYFYGWGWSIFAILFSNLFIVDILII